MIKFYIYLLLFLNSFECLSQNKTTSSSEGEYLELRREYRELIVKDSEKGDSKLFKGLVNKINNFLSEYPDDRVFIPRILYLKGRLLEEKSIDQSREAFDDIVKNYPGDDLADDALLAISRISRKLGDRSEEENALKKIVSDYYESDSYSHAYSELSKSKTSQPVFQKVKPELVENKNIESLEHKYPVVVIDPGHGGVEDGAKGPDGILEKNIVLSISHLVRDSLLTTPNIRVVMTRDQDLLVPLSDRTKLANNVNADLLVSIHANASDHKTGKGIETYYLDNTDDKSSLKLAERENFVDQEEKTDLSFIVSDFIQGIKMDDSITLAHLVQRSIYQNLAEKFDNVKNLGVKRAPFYVLVGAHMPCILVEVSFIDHPVEGRRLGTERYQKYIASGISEAIKNYLRKKGRIN